MEKFDDAALEQVAGYFAALAVPMRLKILNALRGGEHNVGELTEWTGCTQANVSKHLAVLAQNGLVQKASRGTSVYYSIADPCTYELCDMVCGQIGKRYAQQVPVSRMFSATQRKAKRTATRSRR